MAFAVFMHRSDSIYDDSPSERYQFPKPYLTRVSACVGDWVAYLEPSKVPGTRGYFAVAKVEKVVADPTASSMFIALIQPGTYLPFVNTVPFNGRDGIVERGLLNEAGRMSGRAQSAVRPVSAADFNRILERGLSEAEVALPRSGLADPRPGFQAEQAPFDDDVARERLTFLGSRIFRDRVFRRVVLRAYDERCAMTGLKLINGGGRAEVEAAHIRPVEANGPDIVGNALALSGTVHWMFDRGLLSVADDEQILISRQVNDRDAVRNMINADGRIHVPSRPAERPHPQFLRWHRENRFKA